jgi:hypothetical protein
VSFVFGIITSFFVIKGLGGSFHLLFTKLGLVTIHGPVIGGLCGLLMGIFFLTYGRCPSPFKFRSADEVTPLKKGIFLFLFAAILVASIQVRITRIHKQPIDIHQADMLPLVRAGLQVAVQGHNPYRPYLLEDGLVHPGYYLPSLWMIFVPSQLLGIDIRWTTIIVQIISYLLLANLFLSRQKYLWSFEISALIFLAMIGLHSFSKLQVGQVSAVHTAAFSLWLSLFAWSVLRGVSWLIPLVVPLLILAREPAMIFFLPYAAYLFKGQRQLFLRYLGIITLIGLAITLPFIAASGSEFFAVFRSYVSMTESNTWQAMMQHYGLCGPLKRVGLITLQPLLQISGLVTAFLLIFKGSCRSAGQALALGGLSYIPFILFVSMTWGYLFVEPLLLVYFLMWDWEKLVYDNGQKTKIQPQIDP